MPDARWAQLTFASYDLGDGTSGGWRVKETSGAPSDAEETVLRRRAVTVFDPVTPPPPFPSAVERAAIPRRFSYAPAEDGRAWVYTHAVPSGTDATGRPGNVFSHLLLDRSPSATSPALRPLDLWGSPAWLTPFGAREVAAATLAGIPGDAPGGLAGDAALAFVLASGADRRATFSVLLDAVAAALDGGPAVVVATANSADAASWFGAASRFLAPALTRTVPLSVFERATVLRALLDRGFRLIGIPHEDVDAVRAAGLPVVLIDDRETPSRGDLDGTPHLVGGTEIVVTELSVMAETALGDASLARDVLALLDAVAAEFDTATLPAAWPLAVVVAVDDRLEEARDDAVDVLALDAPAGATAHPVYGSAIAAALGMTAVSAPIDPPQPEKGASGAEGAALDAEAAELRERLRLLEAEEESLRAPEGDVAIGAEILRFGDRALSEPGLTDEAAAILAELFEFPVRLLGEIGLSIDLVERTGILDAHVLAAWVRPRVARSSYLRAAVRVPGARLESAVVAWLFAGEPPPQPGEIAGALDLERVLATVDPRGPEGAAWAPFVLAAVEREGSATVGNPSIEPYLPVGGGIAAGVTRAAALGVVVEAEESPEGCRRPEVAARTLAALLLTVLSGERDRRSTSFSEVLEVARTAVEEGDVRAALADSDLAHPTDGELVLLATFAFTDEPHSPLAGKSPLGSFRLAGSRDRVAVWALETAIAAHPAPAPLLQEAEDRWTQWLVKLLYPEDVRSVARALLTRIGAPSTVPATGMPSSPREENP